MRVKDLIAALQQHDPEAVVVVRSGASGWVVLREAENATLEDRHGDFFRVRAPTGHVNAVVLS